MIRRFWEKAPGAEIERKAGPPLRQGNALWLPNNKSLEIPGCLQLGGYTALLKNTRFCLKTGCFSGGLGVFMQISVWFG